MTDQCLKYLRKTGVRGVRGDSRTKPKQNGVTSSVVNYLTVLTIFLHFETGFLCVETWLSWNSVCRIQRSACLCLQSAGIKSVHHYLPATILYLKHGTKNAKATVTFHRDLPIPSRNWPALLHVSQC